MQNPAKDWYWCLFLTAVCSSSKEHFVLMRKCSSNGCTGNKSFPGVQPQALSIASILGCCFAAWSSPETKKWPQGSCQQQPHPSLHSRTLAEPDPSTGPALDSPVYLCGLVERGVILFFTFPAIRERQRKGKQSVRRRKEQGCWCWILRLMGCPGCCVLMLGGDPKEHSHGSKHTLIPIAGALAFPLASLYFATHPQAGNFPKQQPDSAVQGCASLSCLNLTF